MLNRTFIQTDLGPGDSRWLLSMILTSTQNSQRDNVFTPQPKMRFWGLQTIASWAIFFFEILLRIYRKVTLQKISDHLQLGRYFLHYHKALFGYREKKKSFSIHTFKNLYELPYCTENCIHLSTGKCIPTECMLTCIKTT